MGARAGFKYEKAETIRLYDNRSIEQYGYLMYYYGYNYSLRRII